MNNPWFKFYPGDYLRDTQYLTPEEHGCYILMIMTYYSTGKPLPADRFKLAKIFKISPQKTSKILSTLSEFFFEKDGCFYHDRIEQEIEKRKKNQKVKAESGRKGGLAKAKANALAIPDTRYQKEKIYKKESEAKPKQTNGKFKPPTVDEVAAYIAEKNYSFDADAFVNHYEAANWYRGKTKIKNWKACCRTWQNNRKEQTHTTSSYAEGAI